MPRPALPTPLFEGGTMPACPRALADRAVFWAELGLVAAPQVLSRLGHALNDASEEDPELREAMCVAAHHVAKNCSVWREEFSQVGHTGRSSARSELTSTASSPFGIDSNTDDAEVNMKGIFRLVPRHPLVRLLPGLGGLVGNVFWAVCLAAGAIVNGYIALQNVDSAWIASNYLSSNVTMMARGIFAARVLSFIPLVFVVAKLVQSRAFDEALRDELGIDSGERLCPFMKTAAVVIGVLLSLLAAGHFFLRLFWSWHTSYFLLLLYPVAFVSHTIFLLVWKLNMLMIDDLRDRVRLDSNAGPGKWPRLAREYGTIVKRFDDLWRNSGLSAAYALLFVMDIFLVALNAAFAEADTNYSTPESLVWICWHILEVCVGVYLWARVYTSCASTRHSKESLAYLARQHLSKLRRQDALENLCFLQCVEGVPCGVEVPLLGLISTRFVGPVIRIASVVVPVIVGVTLRYATAKP